MVDVKLDSVISLLRAALELFIHEAKRMWFESRFYRKLSALLLSSLLFYQNLENTTEIKVLQTHTSFCKRVNC